MPLYPPIDDCGEGDSAPTRDQLCFVFRNFPLIEIHPYALNAALAAEATAAQGKFWEMHDYIFHHQHTLEDADLARFAEAVGLDMEQYAHDMIQQSYLPRIEEDVESGERSTSGENGREKCYDPNIISIKKHRQMPVFFHFLGRRDSTYWNNPLCVNGMLSTQPRKKR